ncbi:transporter substrate-binding domain-containing protein [soil metagenome]
MPNSLNSSLNFLPRRSSAARLAAALIVSTIVASVSAQTPAPAPATPGPTLDKIRQTGVITLAYRESSAPFSYLVDGKPVGYALELCQRVAQSVQRKLGLRTLDIHYIPVTGATRIDAIRYGQADLECGSTTNNAERRKIVDFTVPHYIAGVKLLVRAGEGIRGLDGLKGKQVAVTTGTTTIKIVATESESRALGITTVEARDHAESFGLVEAHKADAFAMDDILLYSLRAASKNPAGYEVVGDLLSIEPYGIMLRRGDPDFKKLVDAEMARMALDGDMLKLYVRWFQQSIPPRNVVLGVPQSRLLRDAWLYPTDRVGD